MTKINNQMVGAVSQLPITKEIKATKSTDTISSSKGTNFAKFNDVVDINSKPEMLKTYSSNADIKINGKKVNIEPEVISDAPWDELYYNVRLKENENNFVFESSNNNEEYTTLNLVTEAGDKDINIKSDFAYIQTNDGDDKITLQTDLSPLYVVFTEEGNDIIKVNASESSATILLCDFDKNHDKIDLTEFGIDYSNYKKHIDNYNNSLNIIHDEDASITTDESGFNPIFPEIYNTSIIMSNNFWESLTEDNFVSMDNI